jgi:hypothetical protein
MTAETRWHAADNSRANISPICAPHLTSAARPAAAQNGGYLRCAQVMVNYTALGEASPAAVSWCACASIADGVRRHVEY